MRSHLGLPRLAARRRRRNSVVSAVLLAVLVVSACGGGNDELGLEGKRIKALETDLLPTTVLDLAVSREDITKTLGQARRSYVDATSVYSFRSAELLQATLQVSHFGDQARYKSGKFRSAVTNQIGGSRPRPVRMGKSDVFITQGNKQRIAIWFKSQYMFVLSTRDDYPQPRSLLRTVLKVNP